MGTKSTKACAGCYCNFYNGSDRVCWHLKDSKIATRFAIHKDAPMGDRKNYRKVRTRSCYHTQHSVYLSAIPNYAVYIGQAK